jgi:hypothetical protein
MFIHYGLQQIKFIKFIKLMTSQLLQFLLMRSAEVCNISAGLHVLKSADLITPEGGRSRHLPSWYKKLLPQVRNLSWVYLIHS